MTTKSLLEIALEANQYANQVIHQSQTSLAFNAYSAEEQLNLTQSIKKMRLRDRAYDNQINLQANFLRLDYDHDLYKFEHTLESIQQTHLGNCGELVAIALKYVADKYPDVVAEMYGIGGEGGNHVILVLGRKPNSDESDPLDWGDAIISDPLYKEKYPASQFLEKLKNYRYEQDENNHFKNYLEDFDPKKYHLVKIEDCDSHFLNSFHDPKRIQELKNYFEVKLRIIEFSLNLLLENLSELPKNDLLAVSKRITAINTLLEKVSHRERYLNENNQNNYFNLKNALKTNLQEILNEFTQVLSPLQSDYQYTEETRKKMLSINLSNRFFSTPCSLSEIIKDHDAAIAHTKEIFENIVTYERDLSIMIHITDKNDNSPDTLKAEIEDCFKMAILNQYMP